METRASRTSPLWLIGGAVAATALVLTRISTGSAPVVTLPDVARDLVTLSISVFVESLPFVFLGILLSTAVQLFVPAALFDRLLPRRALPRRAVLSLLGILLPVCECGNVPLARGLMLRGFSPAEALTFLLAAPILNPVTVITTYQAFGWSDGILLGRLAGGFLLANLVGWLVAQHPRQEELLTRDFEAACRAHGHDEHGARLSRGVVGFAAEASAMLPALAVGSAIAGAIQVGISRDVLIGLGANPIWSVLALMALAFVIAICSNVDAFFILSFGSTFLPGGIVAFLTFGAMVDVKMIALLRTTFTVPTLLRVTAVVALGSLVLGLAVNLGA